MPKKKKGEKGKKGKKVRSYKGWLPIFKFYNPSYNRYIDGWADGGAGGLEGVRVIMCIISSLYNDVLLFYVLL